MAGAGLTTSLGLSWTTITTDRRLKAAVGYVPYFGYPVFPAFGRDEHGLDNVALPYLAIGGTADTTAPIVETAVGLERLQGPRELVALDRRQARLRRHVGARHLHVVAHVPRCRSARRSGRAARLSQMASVAGGGDDHVLIPLQAAAAVNYGGLWWNAPAGSESGLGNQSRARRRHHLRDVVHLRRQRQGLVAGDDREQDGRRHVCRERCIRRADRRSPRCRSIPPLSSRLQSAPGRCRSPMPTTALSPMPSTASPQTKTLTREVFGPLPTCTFASPIDPRSLPTTRTSGGRIRRAASPAGA